MNKSSLIYEEKPQTLEQFLQYYKIFNLSDLEVVKIWAQANHLETDLSNMAIELTAAKLEEERRHLADARMIIGVFNSFGRQIHNNDYTPEQESYINAWLTQLALYGELNEVAADQAARLVPTMPAPKSCYRSIIYYINKVIGVRFADQTVDEEPLLNDFICQNADRLTREKALKKQEHNNILDTRR